MLNSCVSYTDSIIDGVFHKEELQKKFDSKSELGEYLAIVYDYAGNFWCDLKMFDSLISWLLHHIYDKTISVVCAELVSLVCKHSPKVSRLFLYTSYNYNKICFTALLSSLSQLIVVAFFM